MKRKHEEVILDEVNSKIDEVEADEKSGEENDEPSNILPPKPKVQHTLAHDQKMKHSLYRPPTSEELSELKETENLFKSSLFRMQITELLSEVKLKKSRNKKLDEVLHAMNTLLMSLPDGKEHELADLSVIQEDICLPLPTPPGPLKSKFQFRKPQQVKVIGSYLLGTITKPNINVDVAVQIPKECLQSKDCLNMHYHYKRALYLTELGKHLKNSQLFTEVSWSHSHGDILRPILVLKPKGKAGKMFCVRLHIVIPENVFKCQRFAPDRNNLRKHWYQGDKESQTSGTGPSTPHYNCTLLSDMLYEQHLHLLYNTVLECPGAKDAIVLFKVWLCQRQLDQGFGCFNGFLASMLIAHLLSAHKISKHMSSYQILRVLLQFLSSTDWTTEGVRMATQDSTNLPTLACFHAAFEVVFVDPSGYLNLCSSLSSAMYNRVKEEAILSMGYLNSRFVDAFDALFMKPVPFIRKFDHFVVVQNLSELEPVCKKAQLENHLIDRVGDLSPVLLEWMMPVLRKGLGKRVKHIGVRLESIKKWGLGTTPPTLSSSSLMIGLQLDTEHAGTALDLGPPADSEEAKDFRSFWGNKSELRRFQDSSVREAVVWTCQNAAEKRMICEQVIKHILHRHGNIANDKVLYIGDQLDPLLQQRPFSSIAFKNLPVAGTGEEETNAVLQSFDSLSKDLRSLKQLPLAINTIQGIDPIFRASEIHPPIPFVHNKSKMLSEVSPPDEWSTASNVQFPSETSKQNWNPALNVILQFETSGHWPDDLKAIQNIKAAFHIQLADLLRSQCSLVAAANPSFVDVLKDGYVFRLKVKHYREMVLLEQSFDVLKQEEAKQIRTEMVDLPFLTSTLHGIQQQFHSYGGTVRLAKRWVAAQMLSSHLTDECVELIVASLFLDPTPYTTPGSNIVGLLRFLNMLASFDWNSNPLIVNFNNTLSGEDYQDIIAKFKSERKQFPSLFIATPYDKSTSQWTKDKPSSQVLNRLVVLANESCSLLEKQLQECANSPVDFKQIFRPPLDDYDVLIRLKSKFVARHNQAVDSEMIQTNIRNKNQQVLPVVGFDPVKCYINELMEALSDIALFFYDECGGDVIGVVWKPQAFIPSQFKVVSSHFTMPLDTMEDHLKGKKSKGCTVVPNIAAILTDLQVLGEGLVSRVELQC